MVLVLLGGIQFEAERFETRTMPTPDMKGKEVIYWIKVSTDDKRLASDLQKFLEGAPSQIELKVPSAFVSTKTELENFRVLPQRESKQTLAQVRESEIEAKQSSSDDDSFRLEVLLRRTLSETPQKQAQSPYG
ncbi:MAG: hypothetical protein JRN15_22465 [Nitrososphaerota archaeon]|jgi:hypothetical protein|nr:hypothetical protein [Nitrososphaerota archaeon]